MEGARCPDHVLSGSEPSSGGGRGSGVSGRRTPKAAGLPEQAARVARGQGLEYRCILAMKAWRRSLFLLQPANGVCVFVLNVEAVDLTAV